MDPDVSRFWSTWKTRQSDTFSPQEREAFFQAAVRQHLISQTPSSIRELVDRPALTATDVRFLKALHIQPW